MAHLQRCQALQRAGDGPPEDFAVRLGGESGLVDQEPRRRAVRGERRPLRVLAAAALHEEEAADARVLGMSFGVGAPDEDGVGQLPIKISGLRR